MTQPRRVAAISIAGRVALERGAQLGQEVLFVSQAIRQKIKPGSSEYWSDALPQNS